ncbi:MAG: hypothetical protein ABI068_02820 [Ktedonobacterales bacterium]
MARRDLIQDTDRPHYYSQYWLDVAMGRQKSAAPVAEPEVSADELDDEFAAALPVIDLPKVEARPESKAKATKAEKKPEPAPRPTLNSLADLANIDLLMKSSAEMGDDQAPDIEAGVGPTFDDSVATGFDLAASPPAVEEAEEPATAAEDEGFTDFDEEEEEDEWGAPRRKKGPTKPAKRREQRRDF